MGFAGALAAVVMVWGRGRGALRAALLAFAWVCAVVLALVVPDYRVLMAMAYAPTFSSGPPSAIRRLALSRPFPGP